MQYELTLPADYDMDIIRSRVARSGPLLDDRAGLGLKAYLVRTIAEDGVNQYAPFYLWSSTAAMGHFLLGGGGFGNIVRDFGRPPVQHWAGASVVAGPGRGRPVIAATRRVAPLEWGEPLPSPPSGPALHTAAVGFDPYHWRSVVFALWTEAVAEEQGWLRYHVLHLSTPELDALEA